MARVRLPLTCLKAKVTGGAFQLLLLFLGKITSIEVKRGFGIDDRAFSAPLQCGRGSGTSICCGGGSAGGDIVFSFVALFQPRVFGHSDACRKSRDPL